VIFQQRVSGGIDRRLGRCFSKDRHVAYDSGALLFGDSERVR
jgi:hypothetical protein